MDFEAEINTNDIITEDGTIEKSYDSNNVILLVMPEYEKDGSINDKDLENITQKFLYDIQNILNKNDIPGDVNYITFNVEVDPGKEYDSERYNEIVYFNISTNNYLLQRSSVNDDDNVIVNDFVASNPEDAIISILDTAQDVLSENIDTSYSNYQYLDHISSKDPSGHHDDSQEVVHDNERDLEYIDYIEEKK